MSKDIFIKHVDEITSNYNIIKVGTKNYIILYYTDRSYRVILYIDDPNICIKVGISKDSNLFKSVCKSIRKMQLTDIYSLEYICDKCLNYNSDSDIDTYFNPDDVNNDCGCESGKFLSFIPLKWDINFFIIVNEYNLTNIQSLESLMNIIRYIYDYLHDIKNIEIIT